MLINQRPKATCTLCKMPGHKMGQNCDLLSSLKATLVSNETVKTEYVGKLGDSRFLLVEEPSRYLLREVFGKAVCVIPDTYHLHLKRVYYSENWINFMNTRNSSRTLSQVDVPQIGENLVEIKCLGEGGLDIPDSPTMATVDAVKNWIRQHASKKKRVMCSLPPLKQKISTKKYISKNIYIYYYFNVSQLHLPCWLQWDFHEVGGRRLIDEDMKSFHLPNGYYAKL